MNAAENLRLEKLKLFFGGNSSRHQVLGGLQAYVEQQV